MAQEIIDKYTRSLYNILEVDLINIWENVQFNLPDFVDRDKIKSMFKAEYLYNEIALETIAKFITYLENKVILLNDKYTNLFNAFKTPFTEDDIYANNTGNSKLTNKLYRTPQTQIGETGSYLSEQQDTEGEENFLRGMTKAEAREQYIENIRNVYYDYVREFRDLFMKIY